MPIFAFENRDPSPMVLLIEPAGRNLEVPHLGCGAIRYTLPEGVEERYYSSVSKHQVEVWCDADSYEVDVVPPSSVDKLLWAICVEGGWCGEIIDGKPTRVTDLIPRSGKITAEQFAEMAVRANGWPLSEPLPKHHLEWLQTTFFSYLGEELVQAEVFHRATRRPFDKQPQ